MISKVVRSRLDSDEYGLRTHDPSSTIHLVSPLTKESISINNGGGGCYGGTGTIKTIEMKNEDTSQTEQGKKENVSLTSSVSSPFTSSGETKTNSVSCSFF